MMMKTRGRQLLGSRIGKIILCILFLSFFFCGLVFAQSDSYAVGQQGPAKGLVFYDKGIVSDGWRYLEVSPFSVQVLLPWGDKSFGALGFTSSSLGFGKANTETIAAFQSKGNDFPTAAKYCTNLQLNGYSDWFLPSKEELSILYQYFSTSHNGEFMGIGYGYWTSTEFDNEKAWAQGFYEGVQGRIQKAEAFLVRPIRAF
jgi:hypothetical protein